MDELRNILVVDDEPSIVMTIEMLLEDDYNVKSFDTKACGKQVLEWMNTPTAKVDFAILDLLINGISGIDIAEKVIEKFGDVGIIFLTGCDKRSEIFIKAKSFISDHKNIQIFTKPFDEIKNINFSDFIENELEKAF